MEALCDPVFPLIGLRGFAGDRAKVLVEAGKIGEAAFEAKLFNTDPVVEQEFAGVADTDLGQELGVGLSGPGFEVAAKGVGDEACDGSDVVEIDLPGKMAKRIIVYRVDPVVLRFGEIGAEANGGEELDAVGGGECGKAFDQGGDPADPIRKSDFPDVMGYTFILVSVKEDTAAGLFQQIADWSR
jgi:hypothetical protein